MGTVISAFFTMALSLPSQIGKIFAFCACGCAKCESWHEARNTNRYCDDSIRLWTYAVALSGWVGMASNDRPRSFARA
jgi:hypothetical protein